MLKSPRTEIWVFGRARKLEAARGIMLTNSLAWCEKMCRKMIRSKASYRSMTRTRVEIDRPKGRRSAMTRFIVSDYKNDGDL